MEGENYMKRKIVCSIMLVCFLCSSIFFTAPIQANAEATDIYQVNGKYEITTKKLVTYCELVTADKGFPAKKRIYKITSKTKIQKVNKDKNFSKTTVNKAKAKQLIKKWNKSNVKIQFKKNGNKITYIWYNI